MMNFRFNKYKISSTMDNQYYEYKYYKIQDVYLGISSYPEWGCLQKNA